VANIQLVDTSLRDGNQSLWGATGLTTAHILQIAPIMDRVGFRALDFTSSTHMGVSVRTHKEDPWELIRLTHAAAPHTPLQFIGSGLRFISWDPVHPDLIQIAYDRLVLAGMSRFVVLDPMHDMDAVLRTARMLRRAGASEIIAALTYTISAVHTDDFYAGLAGQMAACPDIDRVYVKDPAGLLSPERTRTLIPAVRARLGGAELARGDTVPPGDTPDPDGPIPPHRLRRNTKPLELHSHCTIGLSPLTCLAAADLGVAALHTACGPLANGTSLPNAERVVANLRELGHTVDIDDRLLARVAGYFTELALAESLPAGQPQEYDASFLRHQVAGGVMTTTRRQLDELGLGDRFGAVMDEVSRVRAELGYPIMVTPFPQIVCGQALYNVLGTERYQNVSDQAIRYVLGRFGRPTAPVDADVADRMLSRPRARELMAEPPPASPAELRRRFPARISDEELLLRATMPADQVDAMLAAGPARRHYNPELKPLLDLLAGLRERPGMSGLVIDKPGFRLELRGGPGGELSKPGFRTQRAGLARQRDGGPRAAEDRPRLRLRPGRDPGPRRPQRPRAHAAARRAGDHALGGPAAAAVRCAHQRHHQDAP
jgi:oxaloacetate decarboxylase (Na+ extruding) subunit alpha